MVLIRTLVLQTLRYYFTLHAFYIIFPKLNSKKLFMKELMLYVHSCEIFTACTSASYAEINIAGQ